jgi:hypothetical protein
MRCSRCADIENHQLCVHQLKMAAIPVDLRALHSTLSHENLLCVMDIDKRAPAVSSFHRVQIICSL